MISGDNMQLDKPVPDSIAGRTVVVTGAASGIGRALATMYAEDGAVVVAVDRNADGLASIQGERIETLVGDVTQPEVMEQATQRAIDRTGRVDVLVNNAGFGLRRHIEDLEVGDFEAVYAVHVLGSLYGIRAVARPMKDQGYGRIIGIVSRAAEECLPGGSAYSAAKAGLWAVSRSAAAELIDFGILVNCLIPGPTNTALWNRPRPDLQSPEAVYPTALALATLPDDGPSGHVFWDLVEYPLFENSVRKGVDRTPKQD
jgi:NAD(P)-dependent dehydrogenase (short-subunit alcohol dehydrogenase family)